MVEKRQQACLRHTASSSRSSHTMKRLLPRCMSCANNRFLHRLSPANLRVEVDVAFCYRHNSLRPKKYNVTVVVNPQLSRLVRCVRGRPLSEIQDNFVSIFKGRTGGMTSESSALNAVAVVIVQFETSQRFPCPGIAWCVASSKHAGHTYDEWRLLL